MLEQYTQICPKCMRYHTDVFKTCTECDTPLRQALEVLGKQDLIATLVGFSIILILFFSTSVAIRAFGQH
jgi:hypothetical protein